MRRRRSDELPRFAHDYGDPLSFSFRWRRRYWLYVAVGVLFIYWLLPSRSKAPTDNGDGTPTINWSSYAYSLYATDSATLCHAILVFDALARFGSKADRVLFYPNYWDTVIRDSKDRDSQLLVMARDRYKVKLEPIQLLTVEGRTKGTSIVAHTYRAPSLLTPYVCRKRANLVPCRRVDGHVGQIGH